MDRAFWRIMACVALVFTYSCGAQKAQIRESRKYGTGIKTDEGVVIFLNIFKSHGESIESEKEKESLANCVMKGMLDTNPGLRIILARDFRGTIIPSNGFLDSPRSAEDFLTFLSDPTAQNRVTELGVRYVVILDADTHNWEKRWVLEPGSSREGFGCWTGQDWTRFSEITANVLDVARREVSGTVTASSSGKCGWGLLWCFCVIPSPPVCWFSRTEAEACSALGEAVMKFITYGHDLRHVPELGTGIDSGAKKPDTQTAPQPASEEDLSKRPQEPGQHEKDSQN